MARNVFDRSLILPFLIVNFVLYMIVLGIAGWVIDSMISGYPDYGNEATFYFAIFSIIAGAVGVGAIIAALPLVQDWKTESVATSTSSAVIAWVLLLVAFGLDCKEISIGHTGTTLNFMEAFVFILTFTQGLYIAFIFFA